ncbi:MAG: hypothetical protein CMM52_13835 [Rhodospirillaceae bacterium]|nr:hypothetical protein [Rhodospirillaceae bacterium]|tara:strand:+ start:9464 stop:9985 length:522 start_codon:yes stop_codon:yes gene_type:complete
MGIYRTFERCHDWLTVVGYYLACVALSIIFGAYIIEVFARYFFNAPQWWASEAVSYSLCACTFLMMPYVTWKRGHVAVALIFDLLPRNGARVALWLTYLLGALFCGFATWISFDETVRQFIHNISLMAVKPVPKYLISIFIPFGFASSTLHFLRFLDFKAIDPDNATGGFGEA